MLNRFFQDQEATEINESDISFFFKALMEHGGVWQAVLCFRVMKAVEIGQSLAVLVLSDPRQVKVNVRTGNF